jgi:hypothetical protein
MDRFDDILHGATAAVASDYVLVKSANSSEITRERVYCYELYMQMRMRWPADSQLILHAEVDKRGHKHPNLRNFRQSPDMLVHVPGIMQRNYAVVEVKPADGRLDGMKKDLRTLRDFRLSANYERAILLLYGAFTQTRLAAIRAYTLSFPQSPMIEVWHHASVGTGATLLERLNATSVR